MGDGDNFDRNAKRLVWACTIGSIVVGFVLHRMTAPDRTQDLGVGPSGGESPIPIGAPPPEASPPDLLPQAGTGHPSGADALSSPPGVDDAGISDTASAVAAKTPGGVYSKSFSFDLETPQEGLLSTTLDLWNSEAFRKITLAEVRALLQPAGLDPDSSVRGPTAPEPTGQSPLPSPADLYDLSGDGLLLDRIGGLPTEEDAVHGLDSPEVQDALYRFLVADGISLEFEMHQGHSEEFKTARENARIARDAAQDDLYEALDSSSGYHHWALLGSIWRALDRD